MRKEITGYQKQNRRRIAFLCLALLLVLLFFFADLFIGSANLSFQETLLAIFSPNDVSDTAVLIVRQLRIPVALLGILVGLSLGTSGCVMQTILENPLASPYTLGIGAGASFGASLAILFGANDYLVALSAFLSSMLISGFIFFFGCKRKISTHTMILLGIALLFLFQALQALVQYFASDTQSQDILFWQFGSLQKADYRKVLILLIALVIVIPLLMKNSWKYTALSLGNQRAESLGIHTNRLKLESFFFISVISSLAVCFTGPIGFIGVASPHMAKALVGEDHRFYLPLSGLLGSLVLLFADVLSKIVSKGSIFPIGIITSLIGVPFFFFILFREKTSHAD